MPTLEPISGSPFYGIKAEGQEIQIKIEKTSPTTARISWNIPTPISGCSEDGQYYNGIVVTIDTMPITRSKEPVDGKKYSSDPTANTSLHSGDKLDTALVVGAFYDNKTTTYVDVTDLNQNSAYYVSGFAVDNTLRYHTNGVHSYSLPYGNSKEPDLNGFQIVEIGTQGTNPTGLVAATNYTFDITIDNNDPETLTVNGTDAATYNDLIDEINKQIALIGAPTQSNGAPNVNAYYWDITTEKLYQWDGTVHNQLDAMVEPTDPTLPTVNDYWYDSDNSILYKWNGLSWITQTVIEYLKDPTNLDCNDYWLNGTNAYKWEGDVWCLKTLYNQAINPSLPPSLTCPTYWFDTANSYLFSWDDETLSWKDEHPVLWSTDPTTLTNGAYWFDTSVSKVKIRNFPNWDIVTTAFVQTTEPTIAGNNDVWFNTDTDILKQYDLVNDIWNTVPCIVWHKDPLLPASCDVWWNLATEEVYIWNILTNAWTLASNFIQSEIDPSLPPVLVVGDVWYDSVNDKLYSWDGSQFVNVNFINHPTDPTLPSVGVVWLNTTTNIFSVWNPTWAVISPTLSIDDPYVPNNGDFWYDTTNDVLYMHNGVMWISVGFSTTPYTPQLDDTYFDTSTQTLMTWNGSSWVVAELPASVALDYDGNLRFDSATLGSTSYILLEDISLFAALIPTATIGDPVRGLDGVSGSPSYIDQDVGTDGSADERRNIMEYIRAQLGYPMVDVELTKTQLDLAIDKALKEFRKLSTSAYRKQWFFITLNPNTQVYKLTDKRIGLNKIVNIMAIHRRRAGLSGTGSLFDQAFIQQLYFYGAFDLTSFHLMNEYVETLEMAFAHGVQFQWNEQTRELLIFKRIGYYERVVLETMIERTEQDLLTDRHTRPWIENWALAEAMFVLSMIRGKISSGLPGAGGGLSFNASELILQSKELKDSLLQDIENYISNNIEDVGLHATIMIG